MGFNEMIHRPWLRYVVGGLRVLAVVLWWVGLWRLSQIWAARTLPHALGLRVDVLQSIYVALLTLLTGALGSVPADSEKPGVQQGRLHQLALDGLASLLGGAQVLALPFLLLAMYVPFALRETEGTDVETLGIGLLVAMLLSVSTHLRTRGSPVDPLRTAPAAYRTRAILWTLVALFAVVFVRAGLRLNESLDADSAYYFGIAKHIATTGRWEEPVVWQYLVQHAQITHPPFDYWQGLPSLILLPPFLIFGATYTVAGLTMAVLGIIGLLAFTWTLARVAPLRTPILAWLAVALFALSPALEVYRYDPESVGVFACLLSCALLTFAQKRYALCVALACGLVFCRGDGLLSCLVLSGSCFYAQRHERTALLKSAGVALGFASIYLGYYYLSFGTLGPPAARLVPLSAGNDVYLYFQHYEPPLQWSDVLHWSRVAEAAHTFLNHQFLTPYVPHAPLWTFGCIVGLWVARRQPLTVVLFLLVFVAPGMVALLTKPVFASWRSQHGLAPAVILLGTYSLDGLLEKLREQLRGRPQLLRAVAPVVVLWLCIAPFVLSLKLPRDLHVAHPRREVWANAMDRRLAGAPVIVSSPWFAVANLRSPAVSIPYNGVKTLPDVIARYKPEFLLLSSRCIGDSEVLCEQIRRGRTNVGPYTLRLVQKTGPASLYRIDKQPRQSTL